MGMRCAECIYNRRHYVNNTTWSECLFEPKYFELAVYGKTVDGRKKACQNFIADNNKLWYAHRSLEDKEARLKVMTDRKQGL